MLILLTSHKLDVTIGVKLVHKPSEQWSRYGEWWVEQRLQLKSLLHDHHVWLIDLVHRRDVPLLLRVCLKNEHTLVYYKQIPLCMHEMTLYHTMMLRFTPHSPFRLIATSGLRSSLALALHKWNNIVPVLFAICYKCIFRPSLTMTKFDNHFHAAILLNPGWSTFNHASNHLLDKTNRGLSKCADE